MIKLLINVRELIWPLLEPLEEETIKKLEVNDCKFLDSQIDLELKYIDEYKASEDNRRKEVESKATIFIGTFAVATTILINLAKEFIFSNKISANISNGMIFILISLTILYLCRAIQFAIRALKRRNYTTFGFPNFMLSELETLEKKKKILVEQYNAIKKNMREINIKVDYMTMAQEYFQRSVITVFLITFIFLSKYVFQNKFIIGKLKQYTYMIMEKDLFLIILFGCIIAIVILFYKVYELEKIIHKSNK